MHNVINIIYFLTFLIYTSSSFAAIRQDFVGCVLKDGQTLPTSCSGLPNIFQCQDTGESLHPGTNGCWWNSNSSPEVCIGTPEPCDSYLNEYDCLNLTAHTRRGYCVAIMIEVEYYDANDNKLIDTFCNTLKVITGSGGKAFAAFSIISIGIGFFTGKVSWGLMIGVSAGIAAMFGAPTIVSAISGEDTTDCSS